jgi:hypothetical protein
MTRNSTQGKYLVETSLLRILTLANISNAESGSTDSDVILSSNEAKISFCGSGGC